MFSANTIAFWATMFSAVAFFIACVAMTAESKYWPAGMYLGLTIANISIAVLATR